MAEFCSCDTGIIDFGQPPCIDSPGRIARIIYTPYRNSAGEINSIAATDVIDQAYIDDKLNTADLSERWYITPVINNLTGARETPVTQTIDNFTLNVTQGARTFAGTFYDRVADPVFLGALESLECQDVGAFYITVDGSIEGICDHMAQTLNPIRIKSGTMYSIWNDATAAEVRNIQHQWQWEETQRDADFSFIPPSSIGVDMLALSSTANVQVYDLQNVTNTGFDFKMSFSYGGCFDADKIVYTAADATGFTGAMEDGTPVTFDTVVESTTVPGQYTATISGATTGNLIWGYKVNGFETQKSIVTPIP